RVQPARDQAQRDGLGRGDQGTGRIHGGAAARALRGAARRRVGRARRGGLSPESRAMVGAGAGGVRRGHASRGAARRPAGTMIASLRGALSEKGAGDCVVEAGGVGYRVMISTHTAAALPDAGAPVFLLTHQVVREDALMLFGFADAEERRLFELLITV